MLFAAFGLGAGLSTVLDCDSVLGLAAVALAWAAWRRRTAAWALPLLMAAAGLALGDLRTLEPLPDALERAVRASEQPLFLWARGTVEEPETWESGCRLTLNADGFLEGDSWTPCDTRIRTYLPVRPPAAGSRLEASLRLTLPTRQTNPGQFDMARYLARKGIRLTASCRSPDLVKPSPEGSPNPLALYRQALEGRLVRDCGDGAGAILALLLGKRGMMSEEEVEVLSRSGLYHLVALSGFQVGLLLFLGAAVSHACLIRPRYRDTASLLLIAGYMLLVAPSPSLSRALVMGTLFVLACLLARPQSALLSWSLALALLLSYNPRWLQDTGFQLTFAATLGIIVLWDAYPKPLPREGAWGSLMKLLWAGFAAQVATLPILAVDFHRISLLGWLATPLASLPVMGIQAVGVPYMFGLAFVPGVHQALGALLGWMADLFLFLPMFLGRSRFGSAFLPTPWYGWIALYAAGFALAALGGRARRAGWLLLGFSVVGAWAFPRPMDPAPRPSLAVLSVGQASCQVLVTGRGTVLMDAGNGASVGPTSGRAVIEPFLAELGVRTLDGILLTHWDEDHAGSAEDLLRDMGVGFLAFPATDPPSRGEPARITALARKAGTLLLPLARDRVLSGPGYTLSILNPPTEAPPKNENDRSLVALLDWRGPDVLFTGDLGGAGEKDLIQAGVLESAGLLLVPHHGSASSSGAAFLASVRPRIAFCSVGWGNRFGQPSPAVVSRYRELGAHLYRTDTDGALLAVPGRKAPPVFRFEDGDWLPETRRAP